MGRNAPPTAALEARQAALRAQMVAAYGDGVRVEEPPAPGDPHVITNLAAWNDRVAEIEREALRATWLAEPSTSGVLSMDNTRRERSAPRYREQSRPRAAGTRGSPAGSSRSDDDPAPPGLLRVTSSTWRYQRADGTLGEFEAKP